LTEPNVGSRSAGKRHVGRVAAALVAGLIVGIVVARAGVPWLSRAVAMLEPIGAIWVNGIRMTVVPLVVSLLLGAVARGGESARVGRIGGLSFAVFIGLHLCAAVLVLAVVPAIMSRLPVDPASVARLQADAAAASAATTEQVRALPNFGQWLASLAPANVVRAAADGAMLPLIVFTLLFALALRRITPERRDNVLRVFDAPCLTVATRMRDGVERVCNCNDTRFDWNSLSLEMFRISVAVPAFVVRNDAAR